MCLAFILRPKLHFLPLSFGVPKKLRRLKGGRQGVACKACVQNGAPMGGSGRGYLALGSASPDVTTTNRALHPRAGGADGRQGVVPVLALPGAPQVKHHPAARVG